MKKDIKNLLHVNKCNYHGIIIIKMKGAIMKNLLNYVTRGGA